MDNENIIETSPSQFSDSINDEKSDDIPEGVIINDVDKSMEVGRTPKNK